MTKEISIDCLMNTLTSRQWDALADLTNKQIIKPTELVDKENILKEIKKKFAGY
jgi:hypothetical protein